MTVADTPKNAVDAIIERLKPGDTLVTVGAGELNQTAQWVFEKLSKNDEEISK